MPAISIVIPCHNEAEAIPAFMASIESAIERLNAEVIVVDDSSTDETPALLNTYSWINKIRLSQRSGYGGALKAGFAQAKADWIVFLDLDATYCPSDLDHLYASALKHKADMVLGERWSRGEGMPFLRGIGNYCYSHLVRVLYGYPIKDACTGYRIFHRKWLPDILGLPQTGLSFSLSMSIWAIKQRLVIKVEPVRYYHRAGRSKLNILSDGLRFFWVILRGRVTMPTFLDP